MVLGRRKLMNSNYISVEFPSVSENHTLFMLQVNDIHGSFQNLVPYISEVNA